MLLLLVWLHLLAAVAWIGSMLFLSLVLVPVLNRETSAAQRGPLYRAIGRRLRLLVWSSIAVLLTTGPLLLLPCVPSLADLSAWPAEAKVKVSLVGLLILVTVLHDFWLGPKVARLKAAPEASLPPLDLIQIRLAPWIARSALVLALAVLLAAAALARS
jgi:uncharacterized membrane protein